MRCAACGASLDPSGQFPGASIRCACGHANTVVAEAGAPGGERSPYRRADVPVADEPVAQNVAPTSPRHDCPRCQVALHDETVDGLAVRHCRRCTGEFVEHDDFRAMIDAHRSETAPAHAPPARRTETEREVRYLRCPMCSEMMTRMNFGKRSGIMLDACRRHGTWFDRGELNGALDFVRAGGLNEELGSGSASDELARAAKVMTSALETERVQQANAVAAATDFVDDLLFVLVPRDQYTAWGDRRRRRP